MPRNASPRQGRAQFANSDHQHTPPNLLLLHHDRHAADAAMEVVRFPFRCDALQNALSGNVNPHKKLTNVGNGVARFKRLLLGGTPATSPQTSPRQQAPHISQNSVPFSHSFYPTR